MVHLAIHLPREALLGGPVQFRWMYPIERLLGIFKGFVANRAHPEGSIAEREERNEDRVDSVDRVANLTAFAQTIRPFGEMVRAPDLSKDEMGAAHWFVLFNSTEVDQYLEKHKTFLQNQNVDNVEGRHRRDFPLWFKQHITQLKSQSSPEATDELWSLANGPGPIVNLYSGCISNGVRFLVQDRDIRRKSQNSGILVLGENNGKIQEFYGYLSKVLELNYMFRHKVCLFQCEWYNTGSKTTYKTDAHLTTIDIRRLWYRSDPYVFPSQVQQVFYVNDTKLGENWKVVERLQRRGIWDVPELNVDIDTVESTHLEFALEQDEASRIDLIVIDSNSNEEQYSRSRTDIDAEVVEDDTSLRPRKRARRDDDISDFDDNISDYDDEVMEQTIEDVANVMQDPEYHFEVDLDY